MDKDEQRETQGSNADAFAGEMTETDESSFVSELVRQALSQRADESIYPLGLLDQQRIDRMLAKLARRRKRVQIAVALMIGLVLALTAGMALLRSGSGRAHEGIVRRE